jgi:hypothetical protein
MSFVGKFLFYISSGEEGMVHTGEVVEQPTPDVVLIRLDGDHGAPHILLAFSIASLISDPEKIGMADVPIAEFFNSRGELSAYLAWIDRPVDEDEGARIIEPPTSGTAIN